MNNMPSFINKVFDKQREGFQEAFKRCHFSFHIFISIPSRLDKDNIKTQSRTSQLASKQLAA